METYFGLYTAWLSKLYFSPSKVQNSDFAEDRASDIKWETAVVIAGGGLGQSEAEGGTPAWDPNTRRHAWASAWAPVLHRHAVATGRN